MEIIKVLFFTSENCTTTASSAHVCSTSFIYPLTYQFLAVWTTTPSHLAPPSPLYPSFDMVDEMAEHTSKDDGTAKCKVCGIITLYLPISNRR